MVVDTPTRSAAHWSDYWSSGALTSLPQDFAFNYDGEVQAFWHEQFASVPDDAAMLDICTGNGPIALLAAGWAAEHRHALEVTAIDAARIRPEAIARRKPAVAELLASIRFMGETPVENLPFDDRVFDLVTSQYGLEYCRLEAAARELARVLKPGGRLAMLTHEASSDVIATMSAEKRDYDALDSARFFRVLRSWVAGQLAEPDFLSRLRRMQPRLQEQFRRTRSPLLGQVMQSIGSLLSMSMADLRNNREAVRGFLGRMEAGRDRLEDMLRVNRRIEADSDWHRPLAEAGLELIESHPLIYRDRHPMGQCYVWRRPA